MSVRTGLTVGLMAAAALAASGQAVQAAPKAKAGDCFYAQDWVGQSAPSDDTLLLRVNGAVFRVGVTSGARELNDPGAYLVSISHGSGRICNPADLYLRIKAQGAGMPIPLIATSLTRLTPAEVAAIPKKDLP